MKKIFYSILCGLAALSCAKNSAFIEAEYPAVAFSGQNLSTKVIMSQSGEVIGAVWSDKDTVGIFSSELQRGNYPYSASIPDPSLPSFARFTAVDASKMFLYYGGTCTYYAYRPYYALAGDSPSNLNVSVPSRQQQDGSDPLESLGKTCLMASAPVTVSDENAADVVFSFKPVMPIVQVAMKMDASTSIQVPLRRIKLISDKEICGDGTLDITGEDALFKATSQGKEITLVTPNLVLDRNSSKRATLVTLPGTYANLSIEVTAIDGSVCNKSLPGATFRQGCSYSKEVELRLSDFVQTEPYDVTASSLSCKAGESVDFTIKGSAETILFWSGERFHDYTYATSPRKEASPEMCSFMHALSAGNTYNSLTCRVSTDFNGNMTEADILAAHWTDISEHFTYPHPEIEASGQFPNSNPSSNLDVYNSYFVASGEYDLAPYFNGKDKLYFAFFWHKDAYDSELNNMRSASYITKFKIGTQYTMTKENITLVNGACYNGSSSTPGWLVTKNGVPSDPMFRFFSDFKPTKDMDAWAVTPAIIPTVTDYGCDTPFTVQKSGQDTPSSYSYKFEKAGTYKVRFVASCPTLEGNKDEVREFTVTVTE